MEGEIMKNRAFDHSHYTDWIDPGDVVPYEKNAKLHDEKQIKNIVNSIRRFGWQQDTVITSDNVLVIGHGRRLAALEIGCEMPYHRIDKTADELTDDDIRELRIADNQTNAETGLDLGVLEQEIEDLSFDGFDFDFGDLNADEDAEPIEVTEDDIPNTPQDTKTKRGDIWQLGRHRLMCVDATSIGDIDKLMDGNTADISITSPPYGESKSAKLRDHYVRGAQKRKTLYNEHEDNSDEWKDLIEGALHTMMAASTAQFINIQMLADNKRDLVQIISDHASELCDIIVWDKQKAAPQMQDNILNNVFEFVFIFAGENASRTVPCASWHGNKNNVIRLPVGTNEFADIHRAVFPVGFPAAIMDIANEAKTVLDVFGGTGTTLIAAEQLNRNCYMMELDPRYCDVIIQRWENFTGEKAVKLN